MATRINTLQMKANNKRSNKPVVSSLYSRKWVLCRKATANSKARKYQDSLRWILREPSFKYDWELWFPKISPHETWTLFIRLEKNKTFNDKFT